jgi:hypothetical protein
MEHSFSECWACDPFKEISAVLGFGDWLFPFLVKGVVAVHMAVDVVLLEFEASLSGVLGILDLGILLGLSLSVLLCGRSCHLQLDSKVTTVTISGLLEFPGID